MTIIKKISTIIAALTLTLLGVICAADPLPDPDCEITAGLGENKNLSNNERLIQAAASDNLSDLFHLLKSGASINYSDNELGTPLAWASRCGNLKAVKYLVSHGAEVNLPVSYQRGMQYRFKNSSALIWATSNEHIDVVRYLLIQGANPSQREEVYKLNEDGEEQFVSSGRAANDVTNNTAILKLLRR